MLIQQVAEYEETAVYEQYTINALRAPRQNEKATALRAPTFQILQFGAT